MYVTIKQKCVPTGNSQSYFKKHEKWEKYSNSSFYYSVNKLRNMQLLWLLLPFQKSMCIIMVKCPIKSVIIMMTHRYVIPLIKEKKVQEIQYKWTVFLSSVIKLGYWYMSFWLYHPLIISGFISSQWRLSLLPPSHQPPLATNILAILLPRLGRRPPSHSDHSLVYFKGCKFSPSDLSQGC